MLFVALKECKYLKRAHYFSREGHKSFLLYFLLNIDLAETIKIIYDRFRGVTLSLLLQITEQFSKA
jgi:hypothetical protein